MKDVQFMTAKEKELVLKQWTRFVKDGFKWEHFTDRLYQHLIMHCSFIAHYNRRGFYQTYFERPEDTLKFLNQFDRDSGGMSCEYGASWWRTSEEYSDINEAMCDAIEPYKQAICEGCRNAQAKRDIALASALMRKHGVNRLEAAPSNR